MTSPAVEAFRRRGLSPKKSFGQNFLVDINVANRIAGLAAPGRCAEGGSAGLETAGSGTVVEIGAGLGALTEPLLARAARVVAIERDRDLCPILREVFREAIGNGRLEIIEADAKSADLGGLLASGPAPRVLAGNLPYQLTGPLLELTTALAANIDHAVYMVQIEVANRLVAAPASPDYGALSVFINAAFTVTRPMKVGRSNFHPRPGVDSAVVVLTPHRPARAEETDAFRAAVRAAFTQRRKTLRNAWSKLGTSEEIAARAAAAGIDLDRRGETLSVEEFARFAATPGGR